MPAASGRPSERPGPRRRDRAQAEPAPPPGRPGGRCAARPRAQAAARRRPRPAPGLRPGWSPARPPRRRRPPPGRAPRCPAPRPGPKTRVAHQLKERLADRRAGKPYPLRRDEDVVAHDAGAPSELEVAVERRGSGSVQGHAAALVELRLADMDSAKPSRNGPAGPLRRRWRVDGFLKQRSSMVSSLGRSPVNGDTSVPGSCGLGHTLRGGRRRGILSGPPDGANPRSA